MYKVTTLNKISPVGLAELTDEYEITADINEANAILVRSQDMLEMDFSGNLRSVARAGAGVNNIPLERCAKEGIVVFNTPGANANAVKELVICGLLLAARNIPQALTWANGLAPNENMDVAKQVEKGKSQFAGNEISGKTLAVVGLGAIGRKICASAKALGMNIIGYDPFVSECEGVKVYADLKEMLPEADYITLHLPANDATRKMINAEVFSAMKDGAVLLNFSRDKLVNFPDLIDAMKSGKVFKYVTDFPTDDVVGLDEEIASRMVLLPHLGASTEEAEDNCAVMAVNETRNYLENGNIINSVNFPRVDCGEKQGDRTAVIFDADDADAFLAAAFPGAEVLACVASKFGVKYALLAGAFETPDSSEIIMMRTI